MQYWIDGLTGYLCIYRDTPGFKINIKCGYVGIPKGHSLYGKSYDEFEINFYEELTFSDHLHFGNVPNSDLLWFFGFDYGHGYSPKTGDITKDCEALAKLLYEWGTIGINHQSST